MNSLVLGVVVGLYVGNPHFRKKVDTVSRKALGKGIDLFNNEQQPIQSKGGIIHDEPESETREE